MTENKRKILLIENQKFQFDIISDYLTIHKYNGDTCFNIHPDKGEEYQKIIDYVRVWVNEQYKDCYRKRAIAYIKKYIEDKKIELIIMDHILGGAFHCLTGIDLATEINNRKDKKNCIPVLFLSKTEQSEKNRIMKYDEYLKIFPEKEFTKWIHKGYFGDEILKNEYFMEKVILEIDSLLKKSTLEQIIDILNYKTPALNFETSDEERSLANAINNFKNNLSQFTMEECFSIRDNVSINFGMELTNYLNNIYKK